MATKAKKATKATKAKKAAKAPAKGRRRSPKTRAAATGVGDLVRQLLAQGAETPQIVEEARAAFPKSAIGPKEVYWYKWKMGQEGGPKPKKKRR